MKTGLQYTKNKRPDTCERLTGKFIKDIEYGNKYFRGYKKVFMLWSPIVKESKGKMEYNQMNHLMTMQKNIRKIKNVKIELMINQKFADALDELKKYASAKTEELKSPVLRVLQIQEYLERHIKNTNKKKAI